MNMVIMGISPHLAMAFKALGGFAPMGTRTIKITVQRQKKNDGSKNPKAANVDPKAATEALEVTNEVTKASVVNEKASVSEVVNTEEVHGTENFSRFFLKICEYFFLDREINISRINKV